MIIIEIIKMVMIDWGLVERYWYCYVDVGCFLKNKLILCDVVGVILLFLYWLVF